MEKKANAETANKTSGNRSKGRLGNTADGEIAMEVGGEKIKGECRAVSASPWKCGGEKPA